MPSTLYVIKQQVKVCSWRFAQRTHWDNLFYQYQQGFLDEEYYEDEFTERVKRLAGVWEALGLSGGRRSFAAELDRLQRTG